MPQIIDSRDFPSKTSDATYTAVMYDNGDTSCNCKGWTMKRPGQERDCRHTVTLRTGTVIKVVTLTEMSRIALAGQQFDKVKQWKNGITGQQMVSLRMMERRPVGQYKVTPLANGDVLVQREPETAVQREARLRAFERDALRERSRRTAEQFNATSPDPLAARDFFPKLPRVTTLGIPTAKPKPIDPPPTRARIAWDEEV